MEKDRKQFLWYLKFGIQGIHCMAKTRKIIEAGKLAFGVETENVTPLELDLTEASNIVVGELRKMKLKM